MENAFAALQQHKNAIRHNFENSFPVLGPVRWPCGASQGRLALEMHLQPCSRTGMQWDTPFRRPSQLQAGFSHARSCATALMCISGKAGMCAVTGPSGEATHLQTDFSHDRSCGMGLCCVLVQAVQRSGLSHQQDFGYDWHNVQTFPFC